MDQLATDISNILQDYHSWKDFAFTPDHVLQWGSQFQPEDQRFILEEFLHLLNQGIYINQEQGKSLLLSGVKKIAARFKFKSVTEFLHNAEFLQLQPVGKSQDVLLGILDSIFNNKVGFGLKQCGNVSKKYCVYIDDILATGGTAFKDLSAWLKVTDDNKVTNAAKIMSGEKVLIVYLFCRHSWAWANFTWRLKLDLKLEIQGKILVESHYIIENHPAFINQKFNLAYPNSDQPKEVKEYLEGLTASSKGETAFRDLKKPSDESFFSSDQNRNRFENVLLMKGIWLLGRAGTLKPNHRPMGAITPSYKTLGTGTLFFTWRNISNTTPIVFWWGAGDIWHPLFPLHGRGLGL